MTFVEIGLIEPVEGYSRSRRFDPELESHHHIHCVRCEKIIDFQSAEYDALQVPKHIQRDFAVLSKKVVINAICDDCRRRVESIG